MTVEEASEIISALYERVLHGDVSADRVYNSLVNLIQTNPNVLNNLTNGQLDSTFTKKFNDILSTDTAVTSSTTSTGDNMSIFRLILQSAPGRVDTGASYPGCSFDIQDQNVRNERCKAIQFATVADAARYSYSHNEIPYVVSSVEEADRFLKGQLPVDQTKIVPQNNGGGIIDSILELPTTVLVGAGVLLFMLLKKR